MKYIIVPFDYVGKYQTITLIIENQIQGRRYKSSYHIRSIIKEKETGDVVYCGCDKDDPFDYNRLKITSDININDILFLLEDIK